MSCEGGRAEPRRSNRSTVTTTTGGGEEGTGEAKTLNVCTAGTSRVLGSGGWARKNREVEKD